MVHKKTPSITEGVFLQKKRKKNKEYYFDNLFCFIGSIGDLRCDFVSDSFIHIGFFLLGIATLGAILGAPLFLALPNVSFLAATFTFFH
jgi:hypothetical protein